MRGLAERLRERGLKVTPQRMAIYRTLCETTAHPTAETIWEKVKEEFPAISFNTVYTTLGILERTGLIQRLHVGENVAHYDADISPHVHLCCERCGRVRDLHKAEVDLKDVADSIRARTGYAISKIELNLYGICPECLQ
ncbi:MAG: Fur family transcriptional regulator [Bacillota bacterium]